MKMDLPGLRGYGGLAPQGPGNVNRSALQPTPNFVTDGSGAPDSTLGVTSQLYYDTSTTPPTLYINENGTFVQVGIGSLTAGENIQLTTVGTATKITGNSSVHTVSTLPAPLAGARSFVTDATQTLSAGLGLVVVGGGTNSVPVYSDGTSWRIG